jgi:two-component system phosphate regulon response regulator PhoB
MMTAASKAAVLRGTFLEMTALIAIVEDDLTLSQMLRYNLEASAYGVEVIERGDDAANRFLRGSRPDLVLLDWILPGLSGIEVLRRMRQTDHGCRIPVIILTSNCDIDARDRAYKLGATDFIIKPFSVTGLMSRISALLDLRFAAETPLLSLNYSDGRASSATPR